MMLIKTTVFMFFLAKDIMKIDGRRIARGTGRIGVRVHKGILD